ncbi:MAG: protein translocase subunit SecF [Deltaproteobacteria bacterium]|jgi:preprotein translocase subunit SecF|nr:protein translocase subunit SecF [Deltaproteobacteria bacterium]
MYEIIKSDVKRNFMGWRGKAFKISASLVITAIIILIVNNFIPGRGNMLNYGIDFTGGTQILVEFDQSVDKMDILKTMKDLGYDDASINRFGSDKKFAIKTRKFSSLSPEKKKKIESEFINKYTKDFYRARFSGSGDQLKVRFFKPVDIKEFSELFKKLNIKATIPKPQLSQEAMEYKAALDKGENPEWKKSYPYNIDYMESTYISPMRHEYTIILQSISEKLEKSLSKNLGVSANILSVESRGPQVGKRLRINGILSLLYALGFILLYIVLRFDLKFAPGAIVALVHDVFITVGIFALFYPEFSLPILAALLTIVGYSLNDTIVVYDRIRENIIKLRSHSLKKIINRSINETLSRTLLTSATTFFAVLAIGIVSTGVLQNFALAMGIGVIVGTYSSIFVASPMVLWFNSKIDLFSNTSTPTDDDDVKPVDLEELDPELSRLEKEKSEEDKEKDDDEMTEEEKHKEKIKKIKKKKRKSKGGRGGKR